ncbi:MAG TPA: hypothetical protein VFD06_08955 [Candidatus Polarisedimenticolia bacterium]|nr:hypothetical protein [Candidatus Polarisedimenticolia bacterium]
MRIRRQPRLAAFALLAAVAVVAVTTPALAQVPAKPQVDAAMKAIADVSNALGGNPYASKPKET